MALISRSTDEEASVGACVTIRLLGAVHDA